MMFRVTYWIAPLIILIVSTVVHIRLLAVVIVNRKQVQYSSFFFKMFISQVHLLQNSSALFWQTNV